MVRGVLYDSAEAVAEAFGISTKTVYGAIAKGREDRIGLGTGTAFPITIRGVTYPSTIAAAKALGVARSTISCALARGRLDRVGLGVDYKTRKSGGHKRPIEIMGMKFASRAELARAIGRRPCSVRASLVNGGASFENIVRALMELQARKDNAAVKASMFKTPERKTKKGPHADEPRGGLYEDDLEFEAAA